MAELLGFMAANGIAPIAYSSLVPLSTWRAEPGQNSAKTADMQAAGANARADTPPISAVFKCFIDLLPVLKVCCMVTGQCTIHFTIHNATAVAVHSRVQSK